MSPSTIIQASLLVGFTAQALAHGRPCNSTHHHISANRTSIATSTSVQPTDFATAYATAATTTTVDSVRVEASPLATDAAESYYEKRGFWHDLFYIAPGGGLHARDASSVEIEKRGFWKSFKDFWHSTFYIPPGGGLHARDTTQAQGDIWAQMEAKLCEIPGMSCDGHGHITKPILDAVKDAHLWPQIQKKLCEVPGVPCDGQGHPVEPSLDNLKSLGNEAANALLGHPIAPETVNDVKEIGIKVADLIGLDTGRVHARNFAGHGEAREYRLEARSWKSFWHTVKQMFSPGQRDRGMNGPGS